MEIILIDNDVERSALKILTELHLSKEIPIKYCSETIKNLAFLRNKSIEKAKGDYMAFIDDDEYPAEDWLLKLYMAIKEYGSNGALGPVLPEYSITPPRWIVKGGFCDRKRFATGRELSWWETRTGNALIKAEIFKDENNRFDDRFAIGGEDVTFFEVMIEKGYRFVWCDEAPVYEFVPPERLELSYFLRRSKLRGFISIDSYRHERNIWWNSKVIIKSLAAVFIYGLLLPLYSLRGYHKSVDLLIRITHNLSQLGTYLGLVHYKARNI